jgi:hypothetical protein
MIEGFFIAVLLVGAGFFLGNFILLALGLGLIAVLMVVYYFSVMRITPTPVPIGGAAAASRSRHKLIQAPENAWEKTHWPGPEEMQGPIPQMFNQHTGMGMMVDPFRFATNPQSFTEAYAPGFVQPHAREGMYFRPYGRQSFIDQLFFGMPVQLGSWMFPHKTEYAEEDIGWKEM